MLYLLVAPTHTLGSARCELIIAKRQLCNLITASSSNYIERRPLGEFLNRTLSEEITHRFH